jgi:hypothetical protein
MTMKRTLLVLALASALPHATACRGDAKVEDKPETLQSLQSCRDSVTEKDKYIKDLEARVYDLQQKSENAEVVVTIAGDEMTVTPAKDNQGNDKPPGPTVPDEELYKSFVDQVQKSRGSIQRCYTNALKKDSGLQVRTVTLKIQVRFKADGSASKSTFTPNISESFDTCMDSVTKKWKLASMNSSITFQQPVTLSPQ